MTVEENKELARRWFDGINAGRPETSGEVVAPDYRMNGQTLGQQGAVQVSRALLAAFPDWHGSIETILVDGDYVAVRVTYTGTHQGDFQATPATDRRIVIQSVEIYRVEGGRIAESWIGSDRLGLMQQLGLLPPPKR